MTTLDIWTPEQIAAAVRLALFLRDNPTANKTDLMNGLSIELGRVPAAHRATIAHKLATGQHIGAKPKINAAIERKIGNVSSVLIEAGLLGVSGFKYTGGFNYQFCLIDALAVALRIPLSDFLQSVNTGRAAYGKRGAAGEFSKSINAALIVRASSPITMAHIEAATTELDHAATDNRQAARSVQRKTEV